MPVDELEQRIDTNKRNGMEKQEIINFLNNDANVQELGKRLESTFNSNYLDRQKNQKFFDAINNATLNNRDFQTKIQNKVRQNVGGLTDTDVFLLYLQSKIDPQLAFSSFKPMISKSGDVYTRYGGQFLLNYIRTKYKNQKYEFWRGWPNILPTTPNKPRTVNEFLKQKKEIILPNNIDFSTFKENTYMPAEFGKLDSWTRENFSIEYDKERIASRKRNAEKGNRINDYIKFDLYIFSLKKYDEYVEKSHNGIVIGVYGNKLNYDRQQTLAKLYFEDLEKINKLFPNIQDIIKNLTKYFDEIKKNQNKYLKNEPGKTMEEKEKIAQNKYEAYVRELEIKQTEIGINDIKESFTKEVTTEKDAKIFFENINKLEQFKTEQEKIKSKYGKSIDNYESFSKSKGALINLYGAKKIQNWLQIYNNYSTKIKSCGDKYKGFDSQKYQMYTKKLSESNIRKHIKNIKIFKENLNIESKGFPINSLKKDYEIQKKEQTDTDKRRENLKKNNYLLYQVFSIGARGINALVSATRGTGAKLGALISSLWHDDDEMVAIRERTENSFRNPHIPLSSKQTQSVYENGHINFNRDNGPGAIADGVVNMRTLIAGGGAIGKGLVKGAAKTGISVGTKGVNITSKIGLFSSSFLQQAGPSFQEGFNAGMTGNQALLYCVLNAGIQGGLELVSPNEILLGSGSKLAKTYVKQILKSESKESRKAIGRLFLKNVGSEIGEENIQEALQLGAGNLINMWANDQFDLGQISGTKKLDTDRNPKNFAATALVTTLTTGLVTGGSFALQSPGIGNNQNKIQLIQEIKNDQQLKSDVMNVIDKAIAGKVKIPNINIQQLQGLKDQLNGLTISETTNTSIEGNNNYFNGKSHQFEVTEIQARGNSTMMDNILNEINEQNKSKKLEELRKNISEQYKQSTGEELNLTDEQLLLILDAHEQDGELGELTIGQLRQKVKTLAETITDPNLRRFLLEAGFCGMEYSEKYKIFDKYERNINISKVNLLEQNILFDANAPSDWDFLSDQPSSFLSVPTNSIKGSEAIYGGKSRIKDNGEVVGGGRGENWMSGMKRDLMTTEGRSKMFVEKSPIELNRIKGFNGEDLYWVANDGNHRVVAAKEIGLSHILAEVKDKSIENGFEKIVETGDKKLVCSRIVRISKGYIDGEVKRNPSGKFELHFFSGAFDGCHLPNDRLSRYAYKYEQLYGPINDKVENILNDIEEDESKIFQYEYDNKKLNKILENYFSGNLDEIKKEFENKPNDDWMNEYLLKFL